MSSKSIKLWIYPPWWFWRGFHSDRGPPLWHRAEGQWYSRVYDFTDQTYHSNGDANTAFPSFKPDYDVFPIPCRSRKQRGWYQVRPRSSEHTCISSKARVVKKDAAARVPEELFHKILDEVVPWRNVLARDVKAQLSQCSLITLSSRRDFLEFMAFITDPGCRFRSYCRSVHVSLNSNSMAEKPWTHRLPCIKGVVWDSLSLSGPLPQSLKTLKSVFCTFPFRLPCIYHHTIRYLTLTDIHFIRMYDLLSLLKDIPNMSSLHCLRLTWGSAQTGHLSRRDRNGSRYTLSYQIPSITMVDCERSAAQALVHMFVIFRDGSGPSIHLNDRECMVSLAAEIEDFNAKVDPSSVKCYTIHLLTETFSDIFARRTVQLTSNKINVYLRLCPSAGFNYITAPAARVASIAFNLCAVVMPPSMPSFNWTQLDKILVAFTALQMVVFGLPSRETATLFSEEVVPRLLPHTCRTLSIRYAVLHQDEQDREASWYRLHPESATMQRACVHLSYSILIG
ncbi:hypothetical protein EIP86_004695 [Pleurotus ostreatoroseus]|nr:hypothetical protein EIP86_004695 [Pleurotus ostreatoroseus]